MKYSGEYTKEIFFPIDGKQTGYTFDNGIVKFAQTDISRSLEVRG